MRRLIERVCGLDVHKDSVTACVRVPGPGGESLQEIRTFQATTRGLLALRDWLAAHKVTHVAMESTGVYWKPPFFLLEDEFTCWLVNAQHIKRVPGRKTDVADAEWICDLAQHGLVRPSFVPPREIRDLRDLTRYRKALVQERTREVQRLEKVLQDAGIKLSSVASKVLGVSGRAMIEALCRGGTDPEALAELAKGRLRAKLPALCEALEGSFRAHHALMASRILAHIDYLEESIEDISGEIGRAMDPFARQIELLDSIPGVDRKAAQIILAEIGVDMSGVFPSAGHLASWAGMCPGNDESGGKRRSGRSRKGDRHLRDILTEVAWAAVRTEDSYYRAQYNRLARHLGKKKAIKAVGHSILVAIYHILSEGVPHQDLGADYFTRRDNPAAHTRRLVRQLEGLGHKVTLEPLAESA